MRRENWEVRNFAIRPAGPSDKCFYCRKELDEQHKLDCVIRTRTVVVRATIEYVVNVPEFWTPEDIERHRNESSWCALNGVNELDELHDRTGTCFCGRTHYQYVREATEQDEELDQLFVEDVKS